MLMNPWILKNTAMKNIFIVLVILLFTMSFKTGNVQMKISRTYSLDSLGACQGVSCINGRIFLYGDRETGILREYKLKNDFLISVNKECRFTIDGKDVINHPTGIANRNNKLTFIGNSVRLNMEGTKWKAMIYCINWEGFLKTGTLDGNLNRVIEDDACIQGTRPEYVKYKNKVYVATSDYGNHGNEVRLYNPDLLSKCNKTSDKGVLEKKFKCSPWVQNLHWIPEKGWLVLIQNQIEGRKWRFTYLDLEKSVDSGKEVILKTVDIEDKQDELEGFTFVGIDPATGIAVTSFRKNNVSIMKINYR